MALQRRAGALVTEDLGEAERLAVAYAPGRLRECYRALLTLDAVLGRAALSTREALPAQLKLAWWREACARLPGARAHPVLVALAETWRADADPLVALVDGWEEIAVAQAGFAGAAETVAKARGAALAHCAGEPQAEAGALDAARVWTLVALAGHAPAAAEGARMRAAARLIARSGLPRALRPLTVLEGLSRRALDADRAALLGDRLSPLAAMRLGIFGR